MRRMRVIVLVMLGVALQAEAQLVPITNRPTRPGSGFLRLFQKRSDGKLYLINSTGSVTPVETGSSGGSGSVGSLNIANPPAAGSIQNSVLLRDNTSGEVKALPYPGMGYVNWVTTIPDSSTALGLKGQAVADRTSGFLYLCVEDNRWVRLPNLQGTFGTNGGNVNNGAGSTLVEIPSLNFSPTTGRGVIGWSKIPEFSLPAGKVLIFQGAGRNLARALGKDVFNWGFTHIDESRMLLNNEYYNNLSLMPSGFSSPIPKSKRCFTFMGNYFSFPAFDIQWSEDYTRWSEAFFEKPDNSLLRNMGAAVRSAGGFGDKYNETSFPYDQILIDVENIGTGNESFVQETTNLWVHMTKQIDGLSSTAKIGTLEPTTYNVFAQPKLQDYTLPNVYLWNATAQATTSSTSRNMPTSNIGQKVSDFMDYDMVGNYWYDWEIVEEGTWATTAAGQSALGTTTHTLNHTTGVNWLCNTLASQETALHRSNKPRVAYQWLFNNDGLVYYKKRYPDNNGGFVVNENAFPDLPATAEMAEGLGVFHFMTGAKGAVLWDNCIDLTGTPKEPVLPNNSYNTNYTGQGIDRKYACYEWYLAGLWRLFANNPDIFNGNEIYLNQNTEVSYNGGSTWLKLNAVQIKEAGHPFVRAVVSGNKILVAATKPYGSGSTSVKVRYEYATGLYWTGDITLNGRQIYLGKAVMFNQ